MDKTEAIFSHAFFSEALEKTRNHIAINYCTYGGAPCIAGTRVPVYAILELLEEGYSHKKILKAFPSITLDQLKAAIHFAKLVMER